VFSGASERVMSTSGQPGVHQNSLDSLEHIRTVWTVWSSSEQSGQSGVHQNILDSLEQSLRCIPSSRVPRCPLTPSRSYARVSLSSDLSLFLTIILAIYLSASAPSAGQALVVPPGLPLPLLFPDSTFLSSCGGRRRGHRHVVVKDHGDSEEGGRRRLYSCNFAGGGGGRRRRRPPKQLLLVCRLQDFPFLSTCDGHVIIATTIQPGRRRRPLPRRRSNGCSYAAVSKAVTLPQVATAQACQEREPRARDRVFHLLAWARIESLAQRLNSSASRFDISVSVFVC
jgi:hypothetical protein